MKDPEKLNRREFTLQSALAVLSGVTITVSSCGGQPDLTDSSDHPHTAAHDNAVQCDRIGVGQSRTHSDYHRSGIGGR